MPEWERQLYYGRADYYLSIPCGRCRLCKSKLAKEWKVRLHYELVSTPTHIIFGKTLPRVLFVTFTFNDDHLIENEKDFAPWIVKFRDNYRKKYKRSPRYFITSDRGSQFGRLHFHGLFFNPIPSATQLKYDLMRWYKFGFVDIRWIQSYGVDEYVTGYLSGANLLKDEPVKHGKAVCEKALKYKPRIFVSNGLGRDCVDYDHILRRDDNLVDINGYIYSLPRYYRDKWYNYTERWYKGLINTIYSSELLGQYEDYESIIYTYRGKNVYATQLTSVFEDTERFLTPEKPKVPPTDWDFVARQIEMDESNMSEFMRPIYDNWQHFDGLNVRWSYEHYYLTSNFPY